VLWYRENSGIFSEYVMCDKIYDIVSPLTVTSMYWNC